MLFINYVLSSILNNRLQKGDIFSSTKNGEQATMTRIMEDIKHTDDALEIDGFAKRLRELRRQKNLTQIELGELVGITGAHIGRYERGSAKKPSAETIKRLAAVLGVSSDYLIEGTSENAAKAKIDDQKLLRQFQEIETLPEEDKEVVTKFLEAFLLKKKIQAWTTE